MHQERWNRRGQPGVFRKKRVYNFYKKIVHQFFEKGWLQLRMAIPVDEKQCVAMDLNFKFKNRLYGEHCAVNDLSPYYRSRPGTSLLFATLHEVASAGQGTYDFGRGAYSYKENQSTQSGYNKKVIVRSTNSVRKLKSKVITTLIRLERRFNREYEQFKLVFEECSVFQGLKCYWTHFSKRLNNK